MGGGLVEEIARCVHREGAYDAHAFALARGNTCAAGGHVMSVPHPERDSILRGGERGIGGIGERQVLSDRASNQRRAGGKICGAWRQADGPGNGGVWKCAQKSKQTVDFPEPLAPLSTVSAPGRALKSDPEAACHHGQRYSRERPRLPNQPACDIHP